VSFIFSSLVGVVVVGWRVFEAFSTELRKSSSVLELGTDRPIISKPLESSFVELFLIEWEYFLNVCVLLVGFVFMCAWSIQLLNYSFKKDKKK